MKTINEKAKAYDEALERARALNNGEVIDVETGTTTCEYIFPELIKYNDEKVRGAIIHFISHTPTVPKGIINKKTMLTWLEKQGKQKFADKVQPKFNVGDWIVTDDSFGKIVRHIDVITSNIIDEGYGVSDENGLIYNISFDSEHKWHKWTIADARDGDVLVCNINKAEIGGDIEKLPNITQTICIIYQNVEKDQDYIHSYCSLYNENSLVLQNRMYYNAFVYNIHPATKEQCDLLFNKMKEAGWEWDSVTKEPKGITKFKVGDNVHCGDETQSVTIIGITNDSYTTDSMIGPIPFSEEDNWTLIKNKFNVGDWIIRNAEGFKHNTYLVKEVKDYYVCEELKGRRVTFTFNDVHNNFKLWDISDAKCGDVLISSPHKQPFVYNGNHTRDDIGAYFGLNYQGELLICDSHGNNWTELTGVQPATEEQCNTLFKKLHDSDYKWDSEKKELWHKYL